MKKIFNLLAIILMTTSVMMAQDKKSFTLEDLMPGGNNYFNLQPKNIQGLRWLAALALIAWLQITSFLSISIRIRCPRVLRSNHFSA